jgi:GTP pyrophosphokinase
MVEQSENLREMLLAMADDWRIIVVKCADRLHNMRTLGNIKKESKRERIARETLDIFVPLANRCGLYAVQAELQDLTFKYLWPDEYESLTARIRSDEFQRHSKAELDSAVQWAIDKVNNDPVMQEHGVKFTVTGRLKSLFSIFTKLRERKYENDLRNVHDLLALRLVLDYERGKDETDEEYEERGRWLCYHAYGLMDVSSAAHGVGFNMDVGWNTVTGQVKDYIAVPKPNGYSCLHALIANTKNRQRSVVEVQIRTGWMHSIAEYGVAAHWYYKEQEQGFKGGTEYSADCLQMVKELEDKIEDPMEFMGVVRKEVLCKRVFVFGPGETIINLARGSTALDAAFKMDVNLGITMKRAVVNGIDVSRGHTLENGDSFEIIRGDVKPTADWLNDAYSEVTKSHLRPYVLEARSSFSSNKGGRRKIIAREEMQSTLST